MQVPSFLTARKTELLEKKIMLNEKIDKMKSSPLITKKTSLTRLSKTSVNK